MANFEFTEDPNNSLRIEFESTSTPLDSIFSYKWEFGDGNSDSGGVQFQMADHVYDTSGIYEVCLTIMANDSTQMICDTQYCELIEVCADPVWPGDANHDGVANNFDILPLGLHYGAQGVSSSDTSTAWGPRCIADWPDSLTGTNINLKHADCNGDGTVDSLDVQPILRNYGRTHNKTSTSPCNNPADPPLFFVFAQTLVEAGMAVDVDIVLGTPAEPITDAYGIVFSVNYDPALVDSSTMSLDYTNSIFQDSFQASITIENDDFPMGKIDGGIVRTDFQTVSGNGLVARLSFVMEDDLVQRPQDLTDSLVELPFILQFSNVQLIDLMNTEIALCSKTDSIVVYQVIPGIEVSPFEPVVQLVPNPVTEGFQIEASDAGIAGVRVFDLPGREVFHRRYPHLPSVVSIPAGELATGTYLVRIETNKGEVVKKLIRN